MHMDHTHPVMTSVENYIACKRKFLQYISIFVGYLVSQLNELLRTDERIHLYAEKAKRGMQNKHIITFKSFSQHKTIMIQNEFTQYQQLNTFKSVKQY